MGLWTYCQAVISRSTSIRSTCCDLPRVFSSHSGPSVLWLLVGRRFLDRSSPVCSLADSDPSNVCWVSAIGGHVYSRSTLFHRRLSCPTASLYVFFLCFVSPCIVQWSSSYWLNNIVPSIVAPALQRTASGTYTWTEIEIPCVTQWPSKLL